MADPAEVSGEARGLLRLREYECSTTGGAACGISGAMAGSSRAFPLEAGVLRSVADTGGEGEGGMGHPLRLE